MNERAQLDAYFAATDGSGRASIVVPLTWPKIRNAEYEVIMRLCRAANNIGSRILVTDNDGYPAWWSDGADVDTTRRVAVGEFNFMVSLHFESPRLLDIYSYYAVWQPIDFYFQFGYEPSVDKLLTHDDALSCSADRSDAHIRTLMAATGTLPPDPFPYLFHSPPEPYHEPNVTARSRLFYVGINWERLGAAGKGRHQLLLQKLEDADLIDIYGPEKLLGVRPWEGFRTYRGELPFDGASVVAAAHRSGICLALSSRPHRADGVMSNRLFEGLAAGNAIIASPHPFIDKYLADVVYELPDTEDDGELFDAVEAIVAEIRSDPKQAAERAREGQGRLRELFSLERCLQSIIDRHPGREARSREARSREGGRTGDAVTVIVPWPDGGNGRGKKGGIETVLRTIAAQRDVELRVVVAHAGDDPTQGLPTKGLPKELTDRFASLRTVRIASGAATLGAAIDAARPHIDTPCFTILHRTGKMFDEHLATLVGAIARHPGALAAASGGLLELEVEEDGERRIRRKVEVLSRTVSASGLLNGSAAPDPGPFAFHVDLLSPTVVEALPLLGDGAVACLLLHALAHGRIAPTGRATYVRVDRAEGSLADGAGGFEGQVMLDTLRFDPAGLRALGMTGAGGAGGTGATGVPDAAITRGVAYDTVIGGSGLPFLREGFAPPSLELTAIEGRHALLAASLDHPAHPVERLQLVLQMGARHGPLERRRRCEVRLNGTSLGVVTLTRSSQRHAFAIPGRLLDGLVHLRVELVVDPAAGGDAGSAVRERAVNIRRFGVFPIARTMPKRTRQHRPSLIGRLRGHR